VDVWLWRARFFKTRALAARMAQSGRIRLGRQGGGGRIDKPSRLVRIGDEIVFALAGRLTAVKVLDLGSRRGPPAEARALYGALTSGEDAPHRVGEDAHSGDLGSL
jgi:ribosomal 50S subunit-recycling heat shock protein